MTSGKNVPPVYTVRYDISLLSEEDIFLFNEGTHYKLFEKLGAHLLRRADSSGVYFAVWAPNARAVYIIGDFNGWDHASHPLRCHGVSGIWEGFINGLTDGTIYKYFIVSNVNSYTVEKADPFAFYCETPPRTASVVRDLHFEWSDESWM